VIIIQPTAVTDIVRQDTQGFLRSRRLTESDDAGHNEEREKTDEPVHGRSLPFLVLFIYLSLPHIEREFKTKDFCNPKHESHYSMIFERKASATHP
jgi:hypothetical protein